MKVDYCKLARDIMPLYNDGLVSEETKAFMLWHLDNCPECANLYAASQLPMVPPAPVDTVDDKFQSAVSFLLRIRKTLLASVAAVILLIIIFAAGGFWLGSTSNNGLLSLRDVTSAFKQQDIHLSKDRQKSPADYECEGIKPVIYKVDQLSGYLFVYVFNSYEERQKVYSHGRFEKSNQLFNQDKQACFFYEARNVLLVLNVPIEVMKPTLEFQQTFSEIKDTVFKDLNDGQEIVFKGESDTWQGEVIVKYYEHWWEDAKGAMKYDCYSTEQPVLKYKGTDLTGVGEINYKYEFPSGSSSASGVKLDTNGMLKGGYAGGNGVLTKANDIGNMTVEWNGKQETFRLQASGK